MINTLSWKSFASVATAISLIISSITGGVGTPGGNEKTPKETTVIDQTTTEEATEEITTESIIETTTQETTTEEKMEEETTVSKEDLEIDNKDENNDTDVEIDEEISEMQKFLSDKNNYKSGYYESWGAAYVEGGGSLCLKDKLPVTEDKYYFKINDERLFIAIQEYDINGKNIAYAGSFYNGDCFTKKENTAFITFNLKSSEWGVNIKALFDMGLTIDLAAENSDNSVKTISLDKTNISNSKNWCLGIYSKKGLPSLNEKRIRYKKYVEVPAGKYVVNLPNGSYTMNIIELDENGDIIKTADYPSGKVFETSEGTKKVALTVFSKYSDEKGEDIIAKIAECGNTGLTKYSKYNYNKVMKDIKAGEYFDAINVGWNLGNSLDSKASVNGLDANLNQETNWGNPYIARSLIDYVKAQGFNTIRIPVTWYYNTYEVEVKGETHLKISEKWLSRVQDVVDYAIENDMYVILNTHHEQPIIYAGISDEEFENVKKNAADIWTDVAVYFKDYDEHLSFESYNEIDNIEKSWNFGENAAKQVNVLNQIFVDTVRNSGGNNNKRILIVPTLLDGLKYNFLKSFELPKDTVKGKLIVQIHTYSKKFGQDIDGDFRLLKEFSDELSKEVGERVPVIIGECGTESNYPIPEFRCAHASNFIARAKAYGLKCVWWDNGSNYGLVNRNNYEKSNTDMLKAIIDGANGIGYEMPDGNVFESIDDFEVGMLSTADGTIISQFWRTLVTSKNGKGVPVKEGNIFVASLTATKGASDVWLQRVSFYDKDGNAIKQVKSNGTEVYARELQMVYYVTVVPEGAVSARISMNSPYENIKLADYEKYIADKDLDLQIYSFDMKSLKKVAVVEK